MEPALYEDRWIACEPDRLIIRWYYLWGRKVIPYRAIQDVEVYPLSFWTGSWRIWGTSDLRYWFHLDLDRPKKTTALVLDLGKWVKPVITPDDPELVARIIAERYAPAQR